MVVTHNRKELLAHCLHSIQNQVDAVYEVILVDNASTDGTVEFVHENYPNIKIINKNINSGFCEGNNAGIRAARAPIVALLNNDAVVGPTFLRQLLAALEDHPDAAMAACKILQYENRTLIDKAGHLIYWDGQNRGRGMGEQDHGQYDRPEEVLWPDGCAAAYRRDALLAVGGFDEDFFAYADDADLGFRLRLAGHKAIYVPTAEVYHHRGSTLGKTNPRRLHLIERNRVLLAFKNLPLPLLLLNPFFYAVRLVRGLWAAIVGKGEVARHSSERGKLSIALTLLRADWEAVRMLPRMWPKRRQIFRTRKLSSMEVYRLMWRYRISLKTLVEDEP